MKIDILSADEVPLIVDVQPEGWGDIIPSFKMYTSKPWCFPLKAVFAENIVGVGAAIIHNNVAWLAHIIVHPSHRNKGFGSIITKYLVELCQERACETICLIATELGAPVYEKVGFVTETEYLMFKEVKLSNDYAEPDSITQNNGELNNDILQLDRRLMGEDRNVELKAHLQGAHVFVAANGIEGFYLPSLGEGLIVASTNRAGIELTKLRLRTKDNAGFPIQNEQLQEFYASTGFAAFKKVKRMILGKALEWQPKFLYNRIGGNLG